MRKEDLIQAIGEAKDEYILEAEPKVIRRNVWKTVLPLAASVLVIAAAGIFFGNVIGGKKEGYKSASPMEEHKADFIGNAETKAMSEDSITIDMEVMDCMEEDYEEAEPPQAKEAGTYNDGAYEEIQTTASNAAGVTVDLTSMGSIELLRYFLDEYDLDETALKEENYENLIENSEILQELSIRSDRVEAVEKVLDEISEENNQEKTAFLKYLIQYWQE